jgi:hypothetical protein
MKQCPVRWFVLLLCVAACAAVAAVEARPDAGRVQTEDRNGDGRPDTWRRYDHRGQLAEVDVDSNFDGSPDIHEIYERGVLVHRESDRDFNGQADLVEDFDAETHGRIRSVVDVDFDGTADLLVLFRDGRPVFSKRANSAKRGAGRASSPAVHPDGAGRLARLVDPFESDLVVRAFHSGPSDEGCVGLPTSGGLRPRVTPIDRLSRSAPLVSLELQPHALTPFLPRSPRAPPVS